MTNLNDPRLAVAALLQDVHALMNNMQATAEQLQYWLNMTAGQVPDAAPAPAPAPAPTPLPVSEASIVDPMTYKVVAKRGRKPKEKHPVLEALLRMSKSWTTKSDPRDAAVLLTPWGIRTLPSAKVYWDYRVETGLTRSCVAVGGRELLDAMKRAGVTAELTLVDDDSALRVDGDVVVTLRAQGAFTAALWDEEDASLQHRPPNTVQAKGTWSPVALRDIVAVSRIASRDTTRGNINNVLLDPRGFAVATDGHRLEARPITHEGPSFLVPAHLASVLATFNYTVDWQISPTHLRISDAGISFTVERCTDTYPDWRRVMPGASLAAFAIKFDRELLLQRSKMKSAGKLPHWYCQLVGNELQVEEYGDEGPVKFSLPVEVLSRPGDECLPRFGLDHTYVRDMCDGYESRYINMFILDQFTPVLFSQATNYESAVALDNYGPTTTHIIMPVRI